MRFLNWGKVEVAAILLMALVGGAYAGPFEHGLAAYQRGDYATAYRFLKPLAEQGNARAQGKIGLMYTDGKGVPRDSSKAVHWLGKAAAQGVTDAQLHLGIIYHVGWGVPQDYAKAVLWYREAAEEGVVQAQFNLGIMHSVGQGVPQNYVEGHKWLNLAAAAGDADAAKHRDLVAIRMTPAEIADAQQLAREWMEKHGDGR